MKDLYFNNIFLIVNNIKGIWVIDNTNFQRETRYSVIHIMIDESLIKAYFAVEKKILSNNYYCKKGWYYIFRLYKS